MNVAIIPARGGSKRIPGKNIKDFMGKPIIHYPIKAAVESGLFAKVIVSTDSEEIANVAIKAGAEVPFERPKSIADDDTPTADVVLHAINWLNAHGEKVKYCCCIYATAPFVTSTSIRKGFSLLSENGYSEVITVTTFNSCIFRALQKGHDGSLEMLWPENELKKTQDFPEVYHDAGQFYWLDSEKFLESKKMWSAEAFPLVLPRYLIQDIDTLEDWETSELLFELCKGKGLL